MNPRKHSRLRLIQDRRKYQRLMNRVFQFIYDENREEIGKHIEHLMLYGVSKIEFDGDRMRHVAVHQEEASHE